MIGTCVVTHNRLSYTMRTITSLLDTARPGDRLIVVDNASSDGTVEWLRGAGVELIENADNRYPGSACNQGWDAMPEADLLHRSDNDIEYLPGWQDEVEAAFAANPSIVQIGLLNLHEDRGREPDPPEGIDVVHNVGGNCVVRAEHFRAGMRWMDRPWAIGQAEDGDMSQRARERGGVGRLRRTVANNIAFGRYWDFPDYYNATAAIRGIGDAEHSV